MEKGLKGHVKQGVDLLSGFSGAKKNGWFWGFKNSCSTGCIIFLANFCIFVEGMQLLFNGFIFADVIFLQLATIVVSIYTCSTMTKRINDAGNKNHPATPISSY